MPFPLNIEFISRVYGRSMQIGRLTFSIQTHYNVKLGTEVVDHMYQVDDVTLYFDPKDNVEKTPPD